VLDGRIEAAVVGHHGPMTVAAHGPRSIIGEVTTMIGGRRTATLRASKPLRIAVIGQDALHQVFDEHPDALLGPGQDFGELGAMLGFPRSATAGATTDVVLTAMPPHEFRAKVEQA